jgi:hypothetical protein
VGDAATSALYPTAGSSYGYHGAYTDADTLVSGEGYWLKFSGSQSIPIVGSVRTLDTISVTTGWNLTGSISAPIAVAGISSIPPGIVTSPFYTYDGTYITSEVVEPGKAYWVKANENGELVLSAGLPASSAIRIVATGELPPPPPDQIAARTEPDIPTDFGLKENYPNPFNPATRITFVLPEQTMTTLRIYDLLGREVATLIDGALSPGTHSLPWDGKDLDGISVNSGVYFYRLQAGRFSETKRLLLLR